MARLPGQMEALVLPGITPASAATCNGA